MLSVISETTPILMYGGQTMNGSALYDRVQEICKSGKRMRGLAQGDAISVILGILAGVDFFETDYPLDLASKHQALLLDSNWPATGEHL